MQNRILLLGLIFPVVLLNSGCPTPGNPYTRVNHDKFEVASKSFKPVNGDGPTITLLGAVHVGEKDYYRQIQTRLDKSSVVLYEAIGTAAEMAEIKKRCPEASDKGGGHSATSEFLGLVNQTEHIKQRNNFVHADMSATQFLDRVGHNPGKELCERIKKDKGAEVKMEIPKHFSSLPHDVKRSIIALALAKSLSHEPENADAESRIILFERNAVALNVLKKHLPYYRAGQEMVIFYGAAHMPDLEADLTGMGYQLDKTDWLHAFTL